jgi:hypothetical protein
MVNMPWNGESIKREEPKKEEKTCGDDLHEVHFNNQLEESTKEGEFK